MCVCVCVRHPQRRVCLFACKWLSHIIILPLYYLLIPFHSPKYSPCNQSFNNFGINWVLLCLPLSLSTWPSKQTFALIESNPPHHWIRVSKTLGWIKGKIIHLFLFSSYEFYTIYSLASLFTKYTLLFIFIVQLFNRCLNYLSKEHK